MKGQRMGLWVTGVGKIGYFSWKFKSKTFKYWINKPWLVLHSIFTSNTFEFRFATCQRFFSGPHIVSISRQSGGFKGPVAIEF